MKKLYVALAAFAAVTAVSLFAAGFAIHGWLQSDFSSLMISVVSVAPSTWTRSSLI